MTLPYSGSHLHSCVRCVIMRIYSVLYVKNMKVHCYVSFKTNTLTMFYHHIHFLNLTPVYDYSIFHHEFYAGYK